MADDVMAEGDLAEALRRLMERGWRTSDPTRRDLGGSRRAPRAAPPPARGAPGALPAPRRPRRRPPGARRHRRRGAGRHRAAARRGGHAAGRLAERPGAPEDAPRRRGPPDRPARRAAAGRRRPDPEARGIRLHGAGGARPVQRADRAAPEADARPVRRRPVGGDPGHDARRTSPRTARWSATSTSSSSSGSRAASRARTRSTTSCRQHGRFFPGARTLDDIVEQLTERMAAMASLLRSMTPQQRAELESMMDALLRDDRLRWDLARLASNMDQLMPDGLGEGYEFSGEQPLGLEPALERIGQLQALDRLEDQLGMVESPGGPRRPRPRRGPRAARAATAPATSRRSTSSPASSRRPATSRARAIGWS